MSLLYCNKHASIAHMNQKRLCEPSFDLITLGSTNPHGILKILYRSFELATPSIDMEKVPSKSNEGQVFKGKKSSASYGEQHTGQSV